MGHRCILQKMPNKTCQHEKMLFSFNFNLDGANMTNFSTKAKI